MFNVPVTFFCNHEFNEAADRAKVFERFAAAGAKHLVLSNSMIRNIIFDHKLADTYRSELHAAGLSFVDAHSPFGGVLDMNCPDPEFRPQMLLRHKMAIRIAAQLGVDTITLHPGSDRFFPEIPLETHLDLMRDAIDNLLPEAEAANVVLCIENSMSRAACPKMVTMLKSEYDSPYLGLCYDAGHAHQLDAGRNFPDGTIWKYWQIVGVPEPEWDDQSLERMLPEIVNCHLHDNDGSGDDHRIPGAGTVNWNKIIPLLKRAPKLRSVQSEVLIEPDYSIEDICRKFDELNRIG